jgi:polar amino acid transport system substrate-binding protein
MYDNLHLFHPRTARILKFHILYYGIFSFLNQIKKGQFMKRSVIFISILVALSLVLAGCGGTSASNHLDAIKKAGVIKVGTSADYPPFESVDSSGNKVGFDIELMTEVANRLGVKVEWVDMPFDSLIAAVQGGKIDASISAFNYSEERDKMIDFSDAYYTSEDSFTVADGFAGKIEKPEDVAAYKVGVQTGTTQDTWLTDNLVSKGLLKEENLFRYDRVDQAMLDLKNGRVDVMMSDYIPAQALVKQLGGLNIVYHGVLSTGPVNIVLPEGDTELKQAVNETIAKLQSEGIINALAVKYFTQ